MLWTASEVINERESTCADNRLQITAQLLLKLKVFGKLSTKEAFKNNVISDKYINLCKAKKEGMQQMACQLCLSHNH